MFLLFDKRILRYRDTGRQVPDGRVTANDYTQAQTARQAMRTSEC